MSQTAFVTGAQGQDGFYLTKRLLDNGIKVVATGRRRLQAEQTSPAIHDEGNLETLIASNESMLHYEICDLRDASRVFELVHTHKPDFVFNLASISSPAECWQNPSGTIANDTSAFVNLIEAVRSFNRETRIVQACTSAIFKANPKPISESSPILPSSPYATAKYASFCMGKQYASKYGMWISNAIMFNHESIRRPLSFVTRKITKGVVDIALGRKKEIRLLSKAPVRDWGWADEFMEAFIRISQIDKPDDFVLATGVGASVGEFAEYVCTLGNIDSSKFLKSIDDEGSKAVREPIDISVGLPIKAREMLNWSAKVDWREVAKRMFSNDFHVESNKG